MKMFERHGDCSLCSGKYFEYGHNPEPLAQFEERCCDDCNTSQVIPARLIELKRWIDENEDAAA